MIVNISGRTDIPAWYTTWLINRFKEKFVYVRNPYNEHQISCYKLLPELVDCILFCSKNPAPLLPYIDKLNDFHIYFHVTITPYGADAEPKVPEYTFAAQSLKSLSKIIGRKNVVWCYDPIFIFKQYDVDFHIRHFAEIAEILCGSVDICVISFLDKYEKVKRNFPLAMPPNSKEITALAKQFSKIASHYNIRLQTCAEMADLSEFGIFRTPCLTPQILSRITGKNTICSGSAKNLRENCGCLAWRDIGAYDTCPHGCRYCYANNNLAAAVQNYRQHDPASPILCSKITDEDKITLSPQQTFLSSQLSLF